MPTLDTRPDGSLVIEADTAAEALAEIGARLGTDAEILSADRVHRGGWRGFFAREQVQLVARTRPGPGSAAGGLEAALARMLEEEQVREDTFQDVLLRELATTGAGPGPAAAPAAPAPPPAPEVTAVPAPDVALPPSAPAGTRTPVGIAWSVEQLRALRLPEVLVGACEGLDPSDDTAWTMTIAGVVGSWCRPLPNGPAALVGPRAHRLATGLGLGTARPGDRVTGKRPVGLRVTDGPTGRAFVSEARGGRWLHLVVGGARWEGLLLEDLSAVSWVGDEALPSALTAAGRLGLVLGYGLGRATGDRPVRATPVDVALTIRSLLPRHA